jgi:cobalt/nickel transport system permease protein
MALGHLTFAGLAELIVSGGVVAYLQRADPALLKLTAPNARDAEDSVTEVARRGGWRSTQQLWVGLALLMVLSPLGLLAAGTAWGEWAPEDFADPAVRQQIQAGSMNHAPPAGVPAGLQNLSSVWTAPIPDYAPAWMQSASFGYIMSALVGAGLIILSFFVISWLARLVRGGREPDAPAPRAGPGTA